MCYVFPVLTSWSLFLFFSAHIQVAEDLFGFKYYISFISANYDPIMCFCFGRLSTIWRIINLVCMLSFDFKFIEAEVSEPLLFYDDVK